MFDSFDTCPYWPVFHYLHAFDLVDLLFADDPVQCPGLHSPFLVFKVEHEAVQLFPLLYILLARPLVVQSGDGSGFHVHLHGEEIGFEPLLLERDRFIECSWPGHVHIEGLVSHGRHFVDNELHLRGESRRGHFRPDNLCGIGFSSGIANQDSRVLSLSLVDGRDVF